MSMVLAAANKPVTEQSRLSKIFDSLKWMAGWCMVFLGAELLRWSVLKPTLQSSRSYVCTDDSCGAVFECAPGSARRCRKCKGFAIRPLATLLHPEPAPFSSTTAFICFDCRNVLPSAAHGRCSQCESEGIKSLAWFLAGSKLRCEWQQLIGGEHLNGNAGALTVEAVKGQLQELRQ